MAKLYVANCTKQHQEVQWRLDFEVVNNARQTILRPQPAKRLTIAPGKQEPLGGELHMDQINDIVRQLRVYGLIAVTEIANQRNIAPLVFNYDQPVKRAHIEQVMARNEGILIVLGRTRRQQAAIVTNETVQNVVAQQFAQAGIAQDPAQVREVEFEQVDQSEAGEKLIGEGYKLDVHAPPPKGASAAATRRAKAKARA